MKKDEKKKSTLEYLQDARDGLEGLDLLKAQKKIDDYFMKNPPKNRNKKKRKRHYKSDDDLWW